MSFNPLAATGLVFRGNTHDGAFLGTAFLFRNASTVVTAAHVIDGLNASDVTVLLPNTLPLETLGVRHIERCPGVDLAALMLATKSGAEPFWNHVSNFSLGEEFMAYGFPEDVMAPSHGLQTPRLFRGHYQRYFHHQSYRGYGYNAGEMSIPAPGGLSGGPVFRPGAFPMLTGLVTENFRSTTILESLEELQDAGRSSITKYQQLIQYGVVLLLDSHDTWLTTHVGQRWSPGAT